MFHNLYKLYTLGVKHAHMIYSCLNIIAVGVLFKANTLFIRFCLLSR